MAKRPAGRQALLMLARLSKNDAYAELAYEFSVGTSTAYRYIREALDVLAAKAPTLERAIEVAKRKAFVVLDGTCCASTASAWHSGYDRAFYSGSHKADGLNVQFIADPAGRLVWIFPPLPGGQPRHGSRPRPRHHRRLDRP